MAMVAPEAAIQAREQAFERLYQRYVGDVYRYALALLRNPTDAEDVTQTAFMNAYRAFKRGDEIQKPHNWLIKITHNVARSRYAHAGRRVQEVPLEEHIEQLAVPEDDKANLDTVLRALGQLPFNQRAALVMRELEGRSYAEIAETLGVSVSAVETLIFRARKSLRVKMSALRVLTGVPLPAQLFQAGGVVSGGGVAGGGAIAGASLVGKALVALAVGVVATGVGGDRSGPAAADADGQRVLASAPSGSVLPAASTSPSGLRLVKGRRGAREVFSGGHAVVPRLGRDVALGAGPAAATGAAVNAAPRNDAAATAPTGVVSAAAQSPHASGPGPQVPSVVALPQVPPVQEVITTVPQNVVNTVTNAVPIAPPTVPVNVPAIPPTPPAVPSVRTPSVPVPPVQVPPLPPVPPLPRLP
jgi:RNA polymerase sigma factor (sigma-70 family)